MLGNRTTKSTHVHSRIVNKFTKNLLGLKVAANNLIHRVYNNANNDSWPIWSNRTPNSICRIITTTLETKSKLPNLPVKSKRKTYYMTRTKVNDDGNPQRTLRRWTKHPWGWVDALSSKLICPSCYGIEHINQQCTVKIFQLDNVVKNYEKFGADYRAGVPSTSNNEARAFLTVKENGTQTL